MTPDRSLWGHLFALAVLAVAFYGLVLYPFELDQLVKGALIANMGMALQWEFGSAVAGSTARQQQRATEGGANAAMTTPPTTTTVDAGPPVTVTTNG